jgi:hypothetical protein
MTRVSLQNCICQLVQFLLLAYFSWYVYQLAKDDIETLSYVFYLDSQKYDYD